MKSHLIICGLMMLSAWGVKAQKPAVLAILQHDSLITYPQAELNALVKMVVPLSGNVQCSIVRTENNFQILGIDQKGGRKGQFTIVLERQADDKIVLPAYYCVHRCMPANRRVKVSFSLPEICDNPVCCQECTSELYKNLPVNEKVHEMIKRYGEIDLSMSR